MFVDANVPMYAAGRNHAFKAPSARFMLAVARRRVDAVSDVEVLQEILHRYAAVRRPAVGFVGLESFA
ncbi:MAG: VapC toxin family PIN domain ribonuclease, partial [Acidobacteria bacterium]|nr:VapC toxin family PIN domain ribonuclease [Acidobacteriota bacterium]